MPDLCEGEDHQPGQIVLAAGNARKARKSGYCYIYVSNESDKLVYFDNLTLTHEISSLIDETHYYPFGLVMAGISSKALNGAVANNRGFNGNELQNKEFFDQSGLEFYDFNARSYDQKVGRFMQVDPMPEDGNQESLSPYHFTGNNPIRYEDANGKCAWCDVVYESAVRAARTINTYINPLTPLVELVTGKSVESDFTVPKPRSSSAVEAGISLIPGGKIEGAIAKQIDKVIVKEGAEAAEKQVLKSSKSTLLSSDKTSSTKIHGNSKTSTKPTTLYKLESSDGEYLKTGVTSQKNPEKRYTNSFMADKKMIRLDNGTRAEMLEKERKIVEENPGPMNREKWAGKNKKVD